jgi:hypothetical protein
MNEGGYYGFRLKVDLTISELIFGLVVRLTLKYEETRNP